MLHDSLVALGLRPLDDRGAPASFRLRAPNERHGAPLVDDPALRFRGWAVRDRAGSRRVVRTRSARGTHAG